MKQLLFDEIQDPIKTDILVVVIVEGGMKQPHKCLELERDVVIKIPILVSSRFLGICGLMHQVTNGHPSRDDVGPS
jgi:hypothetical protein